MRRRFLESEDDLVLNSIYELTHGYDGEGDLIPTFFDIHEITDNYGLEEKEVIDLAKTNGYNIYRIPGGDDLVNITIIAHENLSYGDVVKGTEVDINDLGNDTDDSFNMGENYMEYNTKDLYNDLKYDTNNFTSKHVTLTFDNEKMQLEARKILLKHYNNVETYANTFGHHQTYFIEVSGPKKSDKVVKEEKNHIDKTVRNALSAVSNYKYKYGNLDWALELQARFHLLNWEMLWVLDKCLEKGIIDVNERQDIIKYLKLEESLKEELQESNASKLFKLINAKVGVPYIIISVSMENNRKVLDQDAQQKAIEELKDGLHAVGMWENNSQDTYIIPCDLDNAKRLARDLCQEDFITLEFSDENNFISRAYSWVDKNYSDYNEVSVSDKVLFDGADSLLGYTIVNDVAFSLGLYDNAELDAFRNMDEDIEKHEELNPKLFDGDELKPEVKDKVEQIANQFVKELNEDDIRFTLKDIVLLGSNVSYNYTKDSDLDIHLIADSSGLECPDGLYDKLYSAYRSIFNRNYDITIKGIPAEIYVEMDDTNANSNGIYSINNGWIKHPEHTSIPDLDKEAFDKLFNEWEDRYIDLIGNEDDKLEEELSDDIKQFIQDLYQLRKDSIASDGEYGLGNLVFKEFRNRGYLDNLKELRKKEVSKDLSLEHLDENVEEEQDAFEYGINHLEEFPELKDFIG